MWIFFKGVGESLRNWTFFIFFIFFFWGGGGVSFLYILGRSRSRYRMGIFFGAANFQIFLGIPDIPDFFF